MLEVKDISYTRDGKHILEHVSFTLECEKFYVITGPNGSGKSTLAKIIMGIETPDSGKILLDGKDITHLRLDERAKLGFGFAFQQPVVFKGITVYDLLKFASQKELNRKEACQILSKVGLCAGEYVSREVNQSLSGGELKRIEIATVLAKNPRVAIFDEPEAGIDLWSFRSLIEVFKQMEAYAKGISIVISHQERILEIADQVIWMEQGRIKKIGTQSSIMNQILEPVCPKGVMNCE